MSTNIMAMPSISPGADLDAYLRTVSQFPILEPAEERALAEKFYNDGDLDAARQLVLCHLRFVAHLARTYQGYGLPHADLIQEGNVGLMKAVKRFDPSVGVRLISFAVHWIKAEMHEYILRNWRIVKVATTKAQRKLFFNLRSSKKKLGWLNNKETNAVAQDLGVDPKVVRQMEGRMSAYDTSFDAEPDSDDDTAYRAPAYYLEDQSSDLAENLEETEWEEATSNSLMLALGGLDDRSQDILRSRWLSDEKATLHDLAGKYGVSAERIRQLEKNAMNKIKARMEA